ncbi:hypothetical protein VD659_02310 [Herbiconiux sp. 11R-BC]|uniref:hypothetical protein n=1 Tax=Herbiconiux sp. 11R-BC TaxID=3111637 RepID=UPI003C1004E9
MGIPSAGAYALLALGLVSVATLAVTAGGPVMQSWFGLGALAATVATAGILFAPGAYPLALPRAVAAVVGTTAVSILLTAGLDGSGWPGYAAWHILAATLLLLALAVRGRIALAWIGFGLLTAVCMVWTTADGAGPAFGLMLVERESIALFAGSLFALLLRRLLRDRERLDALEAARAAEIAAGVTALEVRERHVQSLAAEVGESLRAIASGTPASAAERAGYAALEGALRDRIRGRGFCAEPAVSAVREARLRGVEVLLLDDTQGAPLPEGARGAVAEWLAQATAAAAADADAGFAPAEARPAGPEWGAGPGSVTARMTLGATAGELRVSIVVADAAGAVRRELRSFGSGAGRATGIRWEDTP